MSLRRPTRACMVMSMLTATPQITGSRDQAGRVSLTRDEVMTASEVAELLHLPVSTVYYLARRGELPASRLGRAWRFLRPRIERLLEE
jgi:excisionase family DNA binding protein